MPKSIKAPSLKAPKRYITATTNPDARVKEFRSVNYLKPKFPKAK